MEDTCPTERTLAYNTAVIMQPEELQQIGGGEGKVQSAFTTKQTANSSGYFDAGVDATW